MLSNFCKNFRDKRRDYYLLPSQTYAKYMYRLFAAAQAREFSVGCQAKWSNFVDKSNAFPLASTAGLSGPIYNKSPRKGTTFNRKQSLK